MNKLTHEIRWTFIPAGAALWELAPCRREESRPACHLIMTVRINDFADVFCKGRDRIGAWTDLGITRSLAIPNGSARRAPP